MAGSTGTLISAMAPKMCDKKEDNAGRLKKENSSYNYPRNKINDKCR